MTVLSVLFKYSKTPNVITFVFPEQVDNYLNERRESIEVVYIYEPKPNGELQLVKTIEYPEEVE